MVAVRTPTAPTSSRALRYEILAIAVLSARLIHLSYCPRQLTPSSPTVLLPCFTSSPFHQLVKDGLSEKDFKRLKAQGKQGGDETSVAMVNMTAAVGGGAAAAAKSSHDPLDLEAASDDKEGGRPDKRLVKMGLQTALAIGIHNFPEGPATFVATLDDPVVGAGLAIAIAVHNVPEGLCVSVPIYYATRDRWEAFKWAFISGISEPIGAGLGWLVLYRTMDDNAYGVVFGLVAGMMINICISELLPTAFKYDPRDKIVTRCFVGGMAIMALSLVLFLNV